MNKKYFSIVILILSILVISCATKRKGMSKRKKKGCDCPTFSHYTPNNSSVLNAYHPYHAYHA